MIAYEKAHPLYQQIYSNKLEATNKILKNKIPFNLWKFDQIEDQVSKQIHVQLNIL